METPSIYFLMSNFVTKSQPNHAVVVIKMELKSLLKAQLLMVGKQWKRYINPICQGRDVESTKFK